MGQSGSGPQTGSWWDRGSRVTNFFSGRAGGQGKKEIVVLNCTHIPVFSGSLLGNHLAVCLKGK